MYRYLIYITLIFLTLACSSESEEQKPNEGTLKAIAFHSDQEGEMEVPMQRGGSQLKKDFTVWGYKNLTSGTQMVFPGYKVTYTNNTAGTTTSNTHDYEYVGNTLPGSSPAIAQTIKYWDFGASAYSFWGATGGSFNGEGTELTIEGLQQSTTEPIDPTLFSELYLRQPVSTEVVQLKFKRPYAKVRVMFYTADPITSETFDYINIQNITLAPGSGTIPTAGSLIVNYSKTGERETFDITPTTSAANLSFGNVTLSNGHGTASNNAVIAVPTGGTEYYYVLSNDKDVSRSFVLNATIDGESKTATIPAAYMNWQPNYSYTYIFKISGGNRIEIFDVQIAPWKYGGSQDEEWRNW